jgi:non-canonical poly(A) RNA polymerase PAPD5/7
MKPSHSRLTCRAANRFSPSIALWQHFIGCNLPSPTQQRRASIASAAVQDAANEDSRVELSLEASRSVKSEDEAALEGKHGRRDPPALTIRRKKTTKGTWHASKVEASIAKNKQDQHAARQASLYAPRTLLAKTATAFAASKDYTGVVVEPMESPTPVRESSLPWCLKEEERTMAGIDR